MTMKKVRTALAVSALVLVSGGLIGCQKKETATTPPAAKDTEVVAPAAKVSAEAGKPGEHPADQKPKDHPAH